LASTPIGGNMRWCFFFGVMVLMLTACGKGVPSHVSARRDAAPQAEGEGTGTLALTVPTAGADTVYMVMVQKANRQGAGGSTQAALTLSVPAGTGYVVEVSKLVSGALVETGAATNVTIRAGKTTSVSISLATVAPGAKTGSISVVVSDPDAPGSSPTP